MSYIVVLLNVLSINTPMISTVYGYAEGNCGDPHDPKPCLHGAITASGDVFDPAALTAAIPLPKNQIMRPFHVYLRHHDGPCVKIKVNDKMNERYIGKRKFDLTPGAVYAITGKKANKYWSSKGVHVCPSILSYVLAGSPTTSSSLLWDLSTSLNALSAEKWRFGK